MSRPATPRAPPITPALILAFLDHLVRDRCNAVHIVEQALGAPMKRFERPMLGFLSRDEMLAITGKPGSSWTSQRNHLLLHMLYNTGARVSEIIGVRRAAGRCRAGWRRLGAPAWQGAQAADDAAVALDGEGRSGLVEVQPGLAAGIGAAAQPGRAHDDKDQRRAAARAGCGGGGSENTEPA